MLNNCLVPAITIAVNTLQGSNVNFVVYILLESAYLSHLSLVIYTVFNNNF